MSELEQTKLIGSGASDRILTKIYMLSTTGITIATTLIGGTVGVDNQVLVGDAALPIPPPIKTFGLDVL